MCVFARRQCWERTQLQPCRWKRIKFFGRYLCFSFSCMIRVSSWLSPELHRDKKSVDAVCWFPWRNVDSATAKRRNCHLLLQKIQFSKSSDKTSSTTGSSATMFLLDTICTQTSAHWHPKIPLKWYGSIYFVSLVEKKCSFICSEKKPPKIPFKR